MDPTGLGFLEELGDVIEQDDIASRSAGTLLATQGAKVPSQLAEDQFVVTLREITGLRPLRTHDVVDGPAYTQPAAQIVVRSAKHSVGRAVAQRVYHACYRVRNQVIRGTWYLSLTPQGEVIELPLDGQGNRRFALNVLALKRPS